MFDENQALDPSAVIGGLVGSGTTAGGDEELLRIASDFSIQLNADQIRCLARLTALAKSVGGKTGETLDAFVKKYLEMKKLHLSNNFIMAAIDCIALRRLIPQVDVSIARKS